MRSILLALLLAGCGRFADNGPLPSVCPVSETATIASIEGWRSTFGWSDDLAGPTRVDSRSGTKDQVWILRTADPPLFVTLRAQRLDAPGEVSFELLRPGTSTASVAFPGGGEGYRYMVARLEPVLRQPGCWRVSVAGATKGSGIVIQVR
jgi:hypothetical protein